MNGSEPTELDLARCRRRIAAAIAEIEDTGAHVHIVEDHGRFVYVGVCYGKPAGDWLQVDLALPAMLIDGRDDAGAYPGGGRSDEKSAAAETAAPHLRAMSR